MRNTGRRGGRRGDGVRRWGWGRLAICGAALAAMPGGVAWGVTSNWSSALSGNWTDATKWSTNPNYPNNGTPGGTNYDAVIDAVGSAYTVTLNSSVTVDSLTVNSSNATVDQSNSTLSALNGVTVGAGAYRLLSGAVLQNTSVTMTGGQLVGIGGTMNGVSINGTIDVAQQSGANLTFRNNLTLNGNLLIGGGGNFGQVYFGNGTFANQTLSGTATVVFASGSILRINNGAGGTLTIGPNVLIRGGSGLISHQGFNGQVINQGTINADTAGTTINLGDSFGTVSNSGTILASNGGSLSAVNLVNPAGASITGGGTLYLQGNWNNTGTVTASGSGLQLGGGVGTWTNSGTISVTNSTLTLAGTFTTSGIGTINRTGGAVNIAGTLNNSAATLNLNATTGTWNLGANGQIQGGTINTSGGAVLNVVHGGSARTMDGVTINGDVAVTDGLGARLTVVNGLTLNGTMAVGGGDSFACSVDVGPSTTASQTLGGTGTIAMGFSSTSVLNYISGGGTFTIGSGITISGRGRVDNNSASGQLINNGTLNGNIAGGFNILYFGQGNGTVTNNGTLSASSGGKLWVYPNAGSLTNLSGGTLTGGAYKAYANSILDFGSATISTNAAEVRLEGVGSTFNAINGFTTNAAGGTFTVAGSRTFTMASSFTNNGYILSTTNGRIEFGTGTNNGTIECNNGGILYFGNNFSFSPGSFLKGSGRIELTGGLQSFNGNLVGDLELVQWGGSSTYGSSANVDVTTITLGNNASQTLDPGALVKVSNGIIISGGTGASMIITSGSTPATLKIMAGGISYTGTNGIGQLLTAGFGATDGTLDLNGVEQTLTVNNGGASPDLLLTSRIINGALRMSGTGTAELTNANTYAGGTTIANGVLQITDMGALGSGPVTFTGGTLSVRSDLAVATVPNALVVGPTTTMRLNSDRITAGWPTVAQFGAVTLGAGLTVTGPSSQTLRFPSWTLANDLLVNSSAIVEVTGAIGGPHSLTMSGATGSLVLGGAAGNTYSGQTRVTGGTLVLAKTAGALAVPGTLNVLGGTVRWQGNNQMPAGASILGANTGALVDLNGFTQTVASVDMSDGALRTGAGGSLTVSGGLRTGELEANAGGRVTVNAGGAAAAAYVKALDLDGGGTLDLNSADLVLGYGTATGAFQDVNARIIDGVGGNDPGAIISTTGRNAGNTIHYAIDNALVGLTEWPIGSGVSIDSNSVIAKYTYFGDVNLDGQVDDGDYGIIDANYDTSPMPELAVVSGDANLDGSVNDGDYGITDPNYGQGVGNPLAPAFAQAVPEGGAAFACVIGAGVLAATRGRRRRR